MKKLSILALLFCVLSTACSDNDDKSNVIVPGPPTGTEIRYEVSADENIITEIKYRKADGTLMGGTLSPATPNEWSFTIIVGKPFTARVEAKLANTTTTTVYGEMDIFVDGVLAAHKDLALAPGGNLSDNLEHLVN